MSSLGRQGAPTLGNALGTDLYPHALGMASTGGASRLAGYGRA